MTSLPLCFTSFSASRLPASDLSRKRIVLTDFSFFVKGVFLAPLAVLLIFYLPLNLLLILARIVILPATLRALKRY